jgi:biotin carboxylase
VTEAITGLDLVELQLRVASALFTSNPQFSARNRSALWFDLCRWSTL